MKANLMRYLREYGGKSFRELPFSEVDALVLSNLSYLKLTGIVPGFGPGGGVSWEEMAAHPHAKRMFSDPIYGRQHKCMFELVRRSRRYGKIRANYFVEWFDEEQEMQFAAVTFCLGRTSFFLSYRGTDETLVGWKEDFNMGFMQTIPSQKKSLSYLKGVARYTRQGRLILGGHSKGGNLAAYAASCAPGQIQQRIRRIYSFDGPGFRKSFYERAGFRCVEDRLCKIVPEQSLVGMLFANYRDYRVVKSYGSGVLQHDLMQWKIRDGRFEYRKRVYRRSRRKTGILNKWMESLNREQIRLFVDLIYELLQSVKVKSVYELLRTPFRVLHQMYKSFCGMDKNRRRSFLEIIGRLFAAARQFGRGR